MTNKTTPQKPDESSWFNDNSGMVGQSKLFDIDREQEQAALSQSQNRLIDSESTIDREDIIAEEKKIPIFRNPFVKSALVVGTIGTLVLGSTLLYLQSGKTPEPVAEVKPPEQKADNGTLPESQIKGELALNKQKQQLKLDKLIQATPTATTAPATAPPTTGVQPAVQTNTPIGKISNKPSENSPEAVKNNTYQPQPVENTNYRNKAFNPPIAYTAPKAKSIPSYQATTNKPRLTAFGSPGKQVYSPPIFTPPPAYDRTPRSQNAPPLAVNPAVPPTLMSWKEQSTNSTFGGRFQNASENSAKSIEPSDQTYLASESEILGTPGEPAKILPIGAKAMGILLTPIQLVAPDTEGQIIVVGLNQPLVDRNGKIAVPGGSQVQFKVTTMGNGWVKATSQKTYINGQSFDAVDKFTITAQNGQPLIAESKQFGTDTLDQQDRRSFIFSALQKVGSVLTQPDTESSVTAGVGGVASTSKTTAKPNILGAVLQGGFDPLASAQLARSSAEMDRLLSAPKIWFMPVGTNIQIVTTQQSQY
jgi:hypothetical protein